MADTKKYIKSIDFGSENLAIKDTEAVSTINGYSASNGVITNGSGTEVTFANTPITETQIDDNSRQVKLAITMHVTSNFDELSKKYEEETKKKLEERKKRENKKE